MAASDPHGGGDHSHRGDGGFFPPPTTPRATRGGIRLQSPKGGSSWWTRRWLAAIEAAATGDRLTRGLEYARAGQVLELDVELGGVRALVQGTRRAPYETRLELPQLEQETWMLIADAFAARAEARAQLAAGVLPDDAEAWFRRAGATVFPALEDDLAITCTCGDWAVPCLHALAACAILGEAFDAEPLLMLRLRGIEPDLLRALVAGRAAVTADDDGAGELVGAEDALDLSSFWGTPRQGWIDPSPPSIDAPLVRVLGAPRFWRGVDPFEPAMRRIYGRVTTDERTVDLVFRP